MAPPKYTPNILNIVERLEQLANATFSRVEDGWKRIPAPQAKDMFLSAATPTSVLALCFDWRRIQKKVQDLEKELKLKEGILLGVRVALEAISKSLSKRGESAAEQLNTIFSSVNHPSIDK